MKLATVRVVNPADPSSFMTINENELGHHHKLWPNQAPSEALSGSGADASEERAVTSRVIGKLMTAGTDRTEADWHAMTPLERVACLIAAEEGIDLECSPQLRVAKGPGGRWFVMRGKERVAGGFDTEEQAQAAMSAVDG